MLCVQDGKNGMGQAQSQSMGTLDCSDCFGSGEQGDYCSIFLATSKNVENLHELFICRFEETRANRQNKKSLSSSNKTK